MKWTNNKGTKVQINNTRNVKGNKTYSTAKIQKVIKNIRFYDPKFET